MSSKNCKLVVFRFNILYESLSASGPMLFPETTRMVLREEWWLVYWGRLYVLPHPLDRAAAVVHLL